VRSALLALFFGLIPWALQAQRMESSSNWFPEFHFGKIPDSLFAPEFATAWRGHDFVLIFKDYRAAIDYNEGRFRVTLRVSERGKMLTEKGFQNGVFRLSYVHGRGIEEIDSIKLVVQFPDRAKLHLNPDDIQTIQVSNDMRLLQFAVPKAVEGAVYDLQYRIRRTYLDELPEFRLQETHPVLHARAEVRNSQFFVYRAYEKNVRFPLYHHVQLIDTSGTVRFFVDPMTSYLKNETFYARSIPPLPEEPLQAGDERAVLAFRWSEFGRPRQVLEYSWAFTAADLAKRAGYFDERMPQLPSKRKTSEAWKTVFFDVSKAFDHSGSDGFFLSSGNVERVASRADINMELVRKLRKTGFTAFPALISDAGNRQLDLNDPGFLQFDALMACLVSGSDTLLLDAAPDAAFPGLMEEKYLGQPALVIQENGFFWAKTDKRESDVRTLNYQMNWKADGSVQIKTVGTLGGGAARKASLAIRRGAAGLGDLSALFWEQRKAENVVVQQIKLDSLNARVEFEAAFNVRNAGISFADGIDFFPLPVGVLAESPVTSALRRSTARNPQTKTFDITVEMRLPAGHKLTEAPENAVFTIDGASIVAGVIQRSASSATYRIQIRVSEWYFSPDRYAQWQEFYRIWAQLSTSRWRIQKVK
jgi:hypothetical protein